MQQRVITVENNILIPKIIEFLDAGHTVTLRLRGYSMRPFLEDRRDKVLLTKPAYIQRGDVVLALIDGNRYVLHRIIHLKGDEVTLRGDGNIGTEHCTRDDIKGFAMGFYRKERDKIELTNSLKWRLYSVTWCLLFPLRRYLLAIYRRFLLDKTQTYD